MNDTQTFGANGNHKLMLDILCRQSCGLNIVHFNARSLCSVKMDYVRYVFEQSSIDVICVSETWFSGSCSNLHCCINNYNVVRNDRQSKRGGGVAMYCKNPLK